MDRLCCGNCGEVVRFKERVILDELNTVIHMKCFSIKNFLYIKDRGTFKEMVEKYPFFDELKPHLTVLKNNVF